MKNNLATLSSLKVTQVYHTFRGALNAFLDKIAVEGQFEITMTNPYHRDDLWKAANACIDYTPTDPDIELLSAVHVDPLDWQTGFIHVWERRGSDEEFYTVGKQIN